MGFELPAAPAGTGSEFDALVGRVPGEHFGRGCAWLDRTPFAPRIDDLLLDGKQAVESCQDQGSARRAIVVEDLEKGEWHTACAQQAGTFAQVIEGGKPAAECGRILLPATAGGGPKEMGLIGA